MNSLRRILNWIIGVPIAILVVGFAVANRQWVTISFDPFTREAPVASIGMPLWVLLFCGIFIGIVAGWVVCWLAQGKWRRAAREAREHAQRAEAEILKLKQDAARSVATVDQP